MSISNKVQFIGRVGGDPQVTVISSDKKKVTFSIATNESYKDKNGEKKTITDWHNIVAWGKLADIIEKYVKKGSELLIDARHKTDSWEDKETKEKKYSSYFLASEIKFFGSKTTEAAQAEESQEQEWDDRPEL